MTIFLLIAAFGAGWFVCALMTTGKFEDMACAIERFRVSLRTIAESQNVEGSIARQTLRETDDA